MQERKRSQKLPPCQIWPKTCDLDLVHLKDFMQCRTKGGIDKMTPPQK